MTTEPVVGLPTPGPTTVPAVRGHLGQDAEDTRDADRLARIVAAVNAQVRRWPVAQVALGQEDWVGAEDVVEGATMLAARLYRRKNSPAGVEAFGTEGAVYVQRNDPDIAQLLQLGSWTGPGVG